MIAAAKFCIESKVQHVWSEQGAPWGLGGCVGLGVANGVWLGAKLELGTAEIIGVLLGIEPGAAIGSSLGT
jgi:hypothetical protein